MLYLFTWNLKESENAYKLALQHLAHKGQSTLFVACIQEAPGGVDVLHARNRKTDAVTLKADAELESLGIKVVKKPLNYKGRLPRGLALLHHPQLVPRAEFWDEDREFIAAIFDYPGHARGIAVIGLHGWSKVDVAELQEHGAARALLRHSLNSIVELWDCDRVIILGDWNSEAHAVEVSSWHCFYALSGESYPLDKPEMKHRRGHAHIPLYVVKPSNSQEDGTFRQDDSGKKRVVLVDFIAVDQASRPPLANSRILTSVMSQSVWDSTDATKNLSDHRPVEGHLNI